MINNNTKKSSCKSGNKCGHSPDAPRYFVPPEKHAKRPIILTRAIESVKKFYANPAIFPLLNAANGSDRQQRSERREAESAILQCILHYTDLVTLRVGIPQADGAMMGLTMDYLAEKAGLGERRAERAIHDLKKAGLITVHPICQKISDTVYKGVAAIRTVSAHVFTVLGLDKWLRHERDRATERLKKKTAKHDRKQKANIQMGLNALGKNLKEEQPRGNKMRSSSDIARQSIAGLKQTLKPGSG